MNTKALRQKILDLAIHGKLVPQDPNDEPASVLLERIKAEKERLIKEGKIKRPKRSKAACDKPHYPYQLPKGWVWTTLGEICHFENGFAFNSNDYKGNGTPLIRISNIVGNSIDLRGCVFVQKEVDKRFLVNKGNLLIALSGATTGKMGIYASDEVAYLNQRVGNLKIVDATVLHPQYRDLFMLSKTETILKLAYGGAQPNISGSVISSFLLPLPPFAEQQRIVKEVRNRLLLLDSIENEAETLHKSINRVKSKILDLAIHGKLVQQDPNDEPASELLKRINPKAEIACDNAQYGKLPEGWCETVLGNIGTWQSGATPSRLRMDYYGGNIPWLKTGDLNDGIIESIPECITERALEETPVKLNPAGSILMAMYGATIGKIGILLKPAASNQACCACVNYFVDKMFLFYFLLASRERFIAMGGGGAQPNISKEKIIHTHIPLPPLQEQHRIVAKIEELFAQLDGIAAAL